MSILEIGIGVITFRRPKQLDFLLESLKLNTPSEYEVAVFDDSGSGQPSQVNRWNYSHFTTDRNCGVTINKNRALYYFTEVHKKDIIILIEDDCLIVSPKWVDIWTSAINEHGHMNFEPKWFSDSNHIKYMVSSSSSPTQPSVFEVVTGQVTGVRTDLVRDKVGYLNPIFRGFGYGHVEWTNRFIDLGFGGVNNMGRRLYYALSHGIEIQESVSNKNEITLKVNKESYEAMNGKGFEVRIPWGTELEKEEFMNFLEHNP